MPANRRPSQGKGSLASEVSRLLDLKRTAANIILGVRQSKRFPRIRTATIENEIAYQRATRKRAREVNKLKPQSPIGLRNTPSRTGNPDELRVTVKGIFNDPNLGHAREVWFTLGCPADTTKQDLLKCVKDQILDTFMNSDSLRQPSRAGLARRIHSLEIIRIEGV